MSICFCQAVEHGLWTNCLQCGKILCQLEEERQKNCSFCGSPVESKKSTKPNNQKTKKGTPIIPSTYKNKLSSTVSSNIKDAEEDFPMLRNDALLKAEERKAKLLEYDATGAQRSIVKDLTEDFNSNQWLTSEERKRLEKKAKSKRTERIYSYNLEKQVVEVKIVEINDEEICEAPETNCYETESQPSFTFANGKVSYKPSKDSIPVSKKEFKKRNNSVVQQDYEE